MIFLYVLAFLIPGSSSLPANCRSESCLQWPPCRNLWAFPLWELWLPAAFFSLPCQCRGEQLCPSGLTAGLTSLTARCPISPTTPSRWPRRYPSQSLSFVSYLLGTQIVLTFFCRAHLRTHHLSLLVNKRLFCLVIDSLELGFIRRPSILAFKICKWSFTPKGAQLTIHLLCTPLCIVLNSCTHLNSFLGLHWAALGRGDKVHLYLQTFVLFLWCPNT